MGADKIASFYDDPVKMACDAWSMAKAFSFRAVSIDTTPYWRAQRWARFLSWLGKGILRRIARAPRRGDTDPRSLFVVVILLVVILIVVIGLTGRMMRRVALVVP